MANGNILGGIGQGLESFLTNQPLVGIQQRDEQRELQRREQFLQLESQRKQALFTDAREINTRLKANDFNGALGVAGERLDILKTIPGSDPSDTREIFDLIAADRIQEARDLLDLTDQVGVQQGFLTDPIDREIKEAQLAKITAPTVQEKSLGQNEFENLLNIADLDKEGRKEAARVKLRITAAAVGSAAQTISADEQLTQDVARSQAAIESAKETGKLGSQLKLKPVIQKAISLAIGEANLISDNKKLANSNAKALNVYNVGIKSLADSLSKTTTGPFVGRMVALTASAQSAEGAVAIMAPLLKKVFRGAGEGTFSDADQQLLIDMIPTRTDRPAAVKFKLNAIDAIIQARLGPAQSVTQQVQPTTQQPATITPDVDLSTLSIEQLKELRSRGGN